MAYYNQAADLTERDKLMSVSYSSQGAKFYRQKKFRLALHSFNKALGYHPNNKKILIARAHCNLKLGKNDAALGDAEAALTIDPKNVNAMFQKADTLYTMGNFEHALIYFHRGYKMRPDIPNFRLGIQKAQEAIDNSIGKKAGIKLADKQATLSRSQLSNRRSSIKPLEENSSLFSSSKITESTISEHTSKQLLGKLATDKEFFAKLSNTRDFMACIKGETMEVVKLSKEAYNYLQTRQEFWHQQKPLYTRRKEKHPFIKRPLFSRTKSRQLMIEKERRNKEDEVQSLKIQRKMTIDAANMLADIDRALKEGFNNLAVNWCIQLKRMLDSPLGRTLPDKPYIVSTMHSYLGSAYLELNDYDSALLHHERDLYLALKYDLRDCISRALDNLGKIHAKTRQYEEAIKVWESRLPLCKTDLEKAWLHHEIGRCYLELEDAEKAHLSAEKALECAKSCYDFKWQLNTHILMAQCDLSIGAKESAVEEFIKALELAMNLNEKKATQSIKNAIAQICTLMKENDDNNQPVTERPSESKRVGSKNSPKSWSDESDEDIPKKIIEENEELVEEDDI